MLSRPLRTITAAGATLLSALALHAATLSGLAAHDAFQQMYTTRPLDDSLYWAEGFSLRHQDFMLTFDRADILFFEPVTLNSEEHYFAAYFCGDGHIRFRPSVELERDQLKRYVGSDSLVRKTDHALLLFDDSLYQDIRSQIELKDPKPSRRMQKDAQKRFDDLTVDETYHYIFTTLRAHVEPTEHPFLLVNCKPEDSERIHYMYNPFSSEEVSLWLEHRAPGQDFMELVNSYYENIDSTSYNLNGEPKGSFNAIHYDLDGTIDRKGNYVGTAKVDIEIVGPQAQLVRMYLHREIDVDSILDASGRTVPFVRAEDNSHRQLSLFVFLPEQRMIGDTLHLTFYYEGEIAKANLGLFDVTAGGEWYPHMAYRQHAAYDMAFHTPAEYEFVAVGDEIERRTDHDTLITRWIVDQPAANVSFMIGPLKKYEFYDDLYKFPLKVYYSEEVHERIGWARLGYETRGKDGQEEVAEDVMHAAWFFSREIGPYHGDTLVVTEVFNSHGEAFPGFLHLGLQTWMHTDRWGNEHLFRAHETAHQWWGVAVGYETYHDQWLSEGLAEFSALDWLRRKDTGLFREFVEDYGKEIRSVRDYGFGIKGTGPAPIILGSRTAGSKTEGDYQLIVYKKAALMLLMLEQIMDPTGIQQGVADADFRAMLRDFYETYKGHRASTRGFIEIVEKHTRQNMSWFFNQWLYGSDIPKYDIQWTKREDEKAKYIEGEVRVTGVDSTYRMPLDFKLSDEKRWNSWTWRFWITPPVTTIRLDYSREPVEVGLAYSYPLIEIKQSGP